MKEVFLTAEVMEQLASGGAAIDKKIKRHKFRLTNNLISDILFLHTASLKSRCFLFVYIILVFIFDFKLVRKLVFLRLNVNVPEGNTVYK